MTDIELAEKIRYQEGSCRGVPCERCPIKEGCNALLEAGDANVDFREPDPAYLELAESYLLEQKYKEA